MAVVAILASLAAALTAAATVEVPLYAMSPGGAGRVDGVYHVGADIPTFGSDGDLLYLTVGIRRLTPLGVVEAWLDGEEDILTADEVRPPGVTQQQQDQRGRDQLTDSQQKAIFVALSRLGHEVTATGRGALVAAVGPGTPAEGRLEPGDVIIAVEGAAVEESVAAVSALSRFDPGRQVTLTVERNGDSREVRLALASRPEDPTRPLVGVLLNDAGIEVDNDLDLAIDLPGVGGPSAGMMLTLGLIELLGQDDLTGGRRVAGTGTIALDGDVGPIGGVRQKIYAAAEAGAEYVLVPTENLAEARTADVGVEVVAVDTIDDAITFLETLPSAGVAAA